GNVIRVLSRLYDLPDDVTQTATKKKLWEMAEAIVPEKRPGDYNQSLMELGQTLCTPKSPRCLLCPMRDPCLARQRGTQIERPVKPPRKKTPHYDVVAAVIWEDRIGDGRFLIAQRPLDGLLGGLWEFPGGKLEAGETLAQALVREIQEELNVEVKPLSEEPFTIVKHAYTHFRITLHAMHAQFQGGKIEHLGVKDHAWVTADDLENYAFAVTDQKIIKALLSV
ncbi:MAG: NUDIX domain-containing protein, partial [Chloroflexota bacterium]